ncbi:flagellar biosynthetic protein FliR [Ramlibacter pinisoli]|nr:flagellar biosynthetic protein FliR [Ramlibacter sp. CGMCC 1.13660]
MFGTTWLSTTLLMATRLGATLLMTPLLQAIPVPGPVRLAIVLGLAAALALPLAASSAWQPHSLGELLVALLGEAALGATLGLGILLAFAGFAVAGRLLDVQIGFGVAQVFDPLTRSQVPILTSVIGLVGVLLFILADGHHAVLRGIAFSLERFPIGRAWPGQGAAASIVQQASALFALGFALAAPVVLCLFLVDFALGVIARNLPQLNMLALGIPVKIVVGLLALSLWAAVMGTAAGRLHSAWWRGWSAVLQAPAPGGR